MEVSPHIDRGDVTHDRPVIVYYDDATGERTALSAAELNSWVNRTANLLTRTGAPGGLAAVLLPPHWRTAAILLGAWSAGFSVEYQGLATAGLPRIGAGATRPIDVTFVAGNQLIYAPAAPTQFLVRLGDDRPLPPSYRDYALDAEAQSQMFRVDTNRHRTDAASPDGTTYQQWGSVAREIAALFALQPGDRILVDVAEHDHPMRWLLAPLAVGATIVLCANLDAAVLEARIKSEAVTRVL
ncbi:MAG: hypothetical protein QOD41_3611 [Cryptosporangiaceae bacterium]|nr:hypothetical protein [Cryptosporangiaceae bacterium]